MVRRITSLLSLLAVLTVLGLFARHTFRNFGAFTIDDAAISYAYANNVATGHGFRLTPNTNPVEGFSNPLEVLLLVPCRLLGLDLDLSAKMLNIGGVVLGALLAALLVWRNLKGHPRLWIVVPCGFGFLWPTFNHWSAAGLEGGLLCGLQMIGVALLAMSFERRGREYLIALVALLLALTRPEGIVYGGLLVAGRALLPGRRWRSAVLFIVGCVAIFTIRFALFRHWLPNTYFAKVSSQATWHAGLDYVRAFFAAYGVVYLLCGLPLFAFLTSRTRVPAMVAMAQVTFAIVFAVITGGDWMRHFRFMQALQGPYWMLCLLGLLALLTWRPKRGRWLLAWRPSLLLLSLAPMAYFGLHGLSQRIHWASVDHDVGMQKIAKVGALYRELGNRLDLGRPLLIADVDAGGMSFPPGIDVLDMGGLADLTFGYSWTRRPSDIVDYFFDYRRPHTMHTHGGWVDGRPMHNLSPFEREYRVMGPQMLDQLAVSWLTAIRADLVDPPMAPVLPMVKQVGSVRVQGFSSLPTLQGEQAVFVHAVQIENTEPPNVFLKAQDQRAFAVVWHAQHDVARGPAGTALLGMVRVPSEALPLTVEPMGVALTDWPSAHGDVRNLEALSRLPLYRLTGLPPLPCKADELLAVYANVGEQARGARFLADVCGGGLSRLARTALAEDIAKHASDLPRGEDRYDALRVFESLGLPTSTLQLGKIERAARDRSPYDEVSAGWSARLLRTASPSPPEIRFGLGALVLAGQYDKAILTALSRGFVTVAEAREPLCRAMKGLALQPYLLSQLRCGDGDSDRIRVVRQGFENPADPSLRVGSAAEVWYLSTPPTPRLGGQGKAIAYLPPCLAARCSEVVWGPLPWSGRHFGALVAGARVGSSIIVEARQDNRWVEIGHTEGPSNDAILSPVTAELKAVFPTDVRVRVSNRSRARAMAVDALTFLDLD
jgi:hypothetical protein